MPFFTTTQVITALGLVAIIYFFIIKHRIKEKERIKIERKMKGKKQPPGYASYSGEPNDE